MKKIFVCMFVVALVSTSSTLCAQEVETTLAPQTVEPVAEVQSVVVDATAVVETSDALPVAAAQRIGSEVIYDTGVVANGIVSEAQPIQAFDTSCCNTCCEQTSTVQPVVYNQPVISSQPIVPEISPIGAVQETFVPAATSFTAPIESQTFASTAVQPFATVPAQTFTAAPAQNFVSAPVASAPCAASATNECCECSSTRASRLFRQRGLFARLRNGAISSAISDDN